MLIRILMDGDHTFREFVHKEAVFRICCESIEAVKSEIARQRTLLEKYIVSHPEFGESFSYVAPYKNAPVAAIRMANAARLTDVGPMAAVAGTMAQLAVQAAVEAGDREAIVDNGGDIYMIAERVVTVGLYAGETPVAGRLALKVNPADMPISICSSSGTMGHSTSLGDCDLATVVAADAALADAAATRAANLVRTADDIDIALEQIGSIEGVDGLLIVKGEHIGMIGKLPELVKRQ